MSSFLSADDWELESNQIDFLGEKIAAGNITIFLGAGASYDFKLPNWDGLINNMAKECAIDYDKKELLKSASKIKKEITSQGKDFIDVLHRAIYKEYEDDFGKLRGSHTLNSIYATIASAKRASAQVVVTLNYDDVIETFLRFHGLIVQSIYPGCLVKEDADEYVYHPHGFVPYNIKSAVSKPEEIVLTRADYIKIFANTDSEWDILILERLITSTPIFVGLGEDDLNLLRLFQRLTAHDKRTRSSPYIGISFKKNRSDETEDAWNENNIYCKEVENYEDAIAKFLYSCCQKSAEIRKI